MRAYLVKPKRRRNGKLVVGKFWRLRYKADGESDYREICLGVTEKQVADEKRRAFVREYENEAAGIIAPRALREGAAKSMTIHLGEFVAEKSSIKRAGMYVYNVQKRVEKLITECGWAFPKDITPESFEAWRGKNGDKHPKTLNDYLASACAVLNWMERRGCLQSNPLKAVEKVDGSGKEDSRRAFNDDEVRALLAIAGDRRAVYVTALATGLRRSELEALKWADVHLEAVKPFLSVRGSTTKNGKDAVQGLTAEAAEELRRLAENAKVDGVLSGNAAVFSDGAPTMEQFRADLKAAGVDEVDDRGRRVVFHSLRHTLATRLARMKVAPRVAMEFMRHGDMRLTMKVYTDPTLLETFRVAEELPRFAGPESSADQMRATWTDGKVMDSQKDTQNRVQRRPDVSARVKSLNSKNETQVIGGEEDRHTQSVGVHHCPDEGENWGSRIRT